MKLNALKISKSPSAVNLLNTRKKVESWSIRSCFFCKTNEIRDLTFSSAVIAWEGGGGVQVEQQQLIYYAINFSSIAMTAKQYWSIYIGKSLTTTALDEANQESNLKK